MSRIALPSSNGTTSSKYRKPSSVPSIPRDNAVIAAAAPQPHGAFTFDDLQNLGVTLRLETSTFLLGLGSTGSDIVHQIIALFEREFGGLPQSLDYFLIDAASARPSIDKTHFFQMAIDGCGTDPKEGHREFCSHYRHLRSAIMSLVLGLFTASGELTSLGAREATNFWLFAGQGGTSGGAMHPAITLLHDVAKERHIQAPRIHVVLIGPEVSLRDVTRTVTRKQEQVVRDTFASNIAKLSADFKEAPDRTETRPDGTTFHRSTPHHIYALGCNDQSNGEAEFATVPDFVQSMAHSYFLRIVTQCGVDLMDQFCNLDRLNDTGRRDL